MPSIADALQPFVWGSNGTKLTKEEIARQRAISEALKPPAAYVPEGPWGLLGGLASDLSGTLKEKGADAAEKQNRTASDALFAGLGDGYDANELINLAGNENLTGPQSAVAQALLTQQMKQDDPATALDTEYKRAQIDALKQKPAPTVDQHYDTIADPNSRTGYSLIAAPENDPTQYKVIGPAPAPSSGVTVNTGENSSAFDKKASETAATRMSDIVTAGQGAQSFLGDLKALTEISKNLNTGKGAEITAALGPYAQALGFDIKGLDEAQAYEGIISRLAPQMRQPGSGASSDFDARQFLKSLPALGNTPDGNAIITQTFTAIQQAKQAAAEIASRALNGEITWQEADKQIAAIGDPFEAFNKYRADAKKGGTEPGKVPDGVDPGLWEHMTPEERMLWN